MIMSASTHPYPVSNRPFTLASPTVSSTPAVATSLSDDFELKNAAQAASASTMIGRAERVLVQRMRGKDVELDLLTTYATVTRK